MTQIDSLEIKTKEKIRSKKSNPDQNQRFLNELNQILGDHFDFFISDVVKVIFSETSISFSVEESLELIKKVYLEFWIRILTDPKAPTLLDDYTLVFDTYLRDSEIKRLKFDKILLDEIVNTIIGLAEPNTNLLVPEDEGMSPKERMDTQRKNKVNEKYLQYLKSITEQYIIVNYFDYIILGTGLKTLLYLEKVSFGQIHEFRMKLVENFREFLFDTKKFSQFDIIIQNYQEDLSLTEFSARYISNLIQGFCAFLAENKKNWDEILRIFKQNLLIQTRIIKNYLQSPDLTVLDQVLEWIKTQLTIIIDMDFQLSLKTKQEMKREIIQIMKSFLQQQKNYDGLLSSLQNLINYYSENSFLKRNETFENLYSSLIPICNLLAHQLDIDPSLENFADTIKKTEKSRLPGHDDYFI